MPVLYKIENDALKIIQIGSYKESNGIEMEVFTDQHRASAWLSNRAAKHFGV